MSKRAKSTPGRALRFLWFLALAAALLFAAFGLYARHVMGSPEVEQLTRASGAYPCVGTVLDPVWPRDRPEPQIARHYLLSGERSYGPGLNWHLRFALVIAAIGWSTDATRANRLYAATPMGGWGDFDRVALTRSGRHFCQLDEPHRQAVRSFFRSADVRALEAAFGQRPST